MAWKTKLKESLGFFVYLWKFLFHNIRKCTIKMEDIIFNS